MVNDENIQKVSVTSPLWEGEVIFSVKESIVLDAPTLVKNRIFRAIICGHVRTSGNKINTPDGILRSEMLNPSNCYIQTMLDIPFREDKKEISEDINTPESTGTGETTTVRETTLPLWDDIGNVPIGEVPEERRTFHFPRG